MAHLPNPGGRIPPGYLYGRDAQIKKFWQTLDLQSVYLNDLRRIGKTQLIQSMAAEPPDGWVCVKADVGGVHTAMEFAKLAYQDSASALPPGAQVFRNVEALSTRLGGAKIGNFFTFPESAMKSWKELLRVTFDDLNTEMQRQGKKFVFFWDEIPFFLDNLISRELPRDAEEFLDLLRSLCQDHHHIRLFLTGSIGLHHILTGLRVRGYHNRPLSHMAAVNIGPIPAPDAENLTTDLIAGVGARTPDPAALAKQIATLTGHVPFYIHHLVNCLAAGENVTPSVAETKLDAKLRDSNNDWDLPHYRDRIEKYYSKTGVGCSIRDTAFVILNAISTTQPLPYEAVRQAVAEKLTSDEQARAVLTLLCQDYYLESTEEGYRFYLEIVRRWWAINCAD
jgi:hypothetical protein